MERPEVILVDIGNTRIKITEVFDGVLANQKTIISIESIDEIYPADIPMMISSVRKLDLSFGRKYTLLSNTTSLPIKLDYKTKDTLGVDRIAAAVGAYALFPESTSLIIDMGTCITIDLLENGTVFRGGVISPGLKMRFQSMAAFTDNLPDLSSEWEHTKNVLPGKSTSECMINGVIEGIRMEINGYIEQFERKFTSINAILTGGDAHFFESRIKPPIFAGLKIVETGLYRIWKYQ